MESLRHLLHRHRRIAAGVIALALAMKLLVPAGYMLGTTAAQVLTVEICADAQGTRLTQQIVIPMRGETGHGDQAKGDGACAWGSLAMGSLGTVDAMLLALALAFILLLGFAPVPSAPRAAPAHLRPPLRGPPAFA